jgi:hypothetical protein
MKKIIKRTMIILITVMMMWMMMSWIDIVSDNTSNEPTHSQYNFFCMMFNRQYEMCGVVADAGLVVDDNGEAWYVDTTQYPVGTEVFITMIDKGTPQFKDDEIIDIREIERD